MRLGTFSMSGPSNFVGITFAFERTCLTFSLTGQVLWSHEVFEKFDGLIYSLKPNIFELFLANKAVLSLRPAL